MKTKLFLFVVGFFLLQSCSVQIGILHPKPQLHLPVSERTLALILDKNIENEYDIPEYAGIRKSKVTHWRESLKNGFINGFQDDFILVFKEDQPVYLLKLEKTTLSLNPLTISGYKPITALKAELEFRALLLSPTGEVVDRIDAKAQSSIAAKNTAEIKDAVRSAIENMYEIIANKFFKSEN